MTKHPLTYRRRGATSRARHLRRDETDAEYKLWYRLSRRELAGYKFVRQAPLGPYMVDFLCRSERLVVEIDGEQHADSLKDSVRTAYLRFAAAPSPGRFATRPLPGGERKEAPKS